MIVKRVYDFPTLAISLPRCREVKTIGRTAQGCHFLTDQKDCFLRKKETENTLHYFGKCIKVLRNAYM